LGVIEYVTVPEPDPGDPPVTESQPGLLLEAIHAHPESAVTATVAPETPPGNSLRSEYGVIRLLHGVHACTVKASRGWPRYVNCGLGGVAVPGEYV
jgi:hypothetical protein